jgi:hypothetical protein
VSKQTEYVIELTKFELAVLYATIGPMVGGILPDGRDPLKDIARAIEAIPNEEAFFKAIVRNYDGDLFNSYRGDAAVAAAVKTLEG